MPANKKEYQYKYTKEKLKRISFNVQKDYYENNLKPAADRAGESINGYIKKSIDQRIDRETEE